VPLQSGEFSESKNRSLVVVFPCPYSLAILLLTREWGQGNKELRNEWMLRGNALIRRVNGLVFGKC
jgi:hypothetical protein